MKATHFAPNHLRVILSLSMLVLAFRNISETRLVAETNHSTVQFSVPISNGLTRITGKFTDYTIDINFTDKDLAKSKVVAVIKTNSINTGIPARDADLATADFFEAEKYPEITFTSDSIRKDKNGFLAFGKFQMHGITQVIILPFEITGMDGDDVIGFRSRYTLKRSDFGVGTAFKHTSDDNFVGDAIGVEIDFWTKRYKEKNNKQSGD